MMPNTHRYRRTVSSLAVAILLVGCAAGGDDSRSLLKDDENEVPSAELSLRVLEKFTDGTFRVGIVISNPHRESITSVRSWVSFQPAALAVDALRIEDERFSLVAPGEWEVAEGDGLMKIGLATPEPVRDGEILLASFRAAADPELRSPLTFYDWRADGKGHTTVLKVKVNGDVTPLLLPPTSLTLP